jgi:hypothetical protein
LPIENQTAVEENDGSSAQSEEQPIQGGDPLAGDEILQSVVKNLVSHFSGIEKFTRRQEVMETRRQRFFWRNDQFIYWNYQMWAFVPVTGGGGVGSSSGNSVDSPSEMNVYNIYTPFGESLIAPLAQNPPGVHFEPDNPMNPTDVSKAKASEKYKEQIDRDNTMKALRTEVARLMYTDNRLVLYTRPISDEQELGEDENGKPNTKQLITAHGTLESKVVPLTARTRGDLVAAFISDEMEINLAKETYPDAADKIMEGASSAGESAYERFARLGVLQGSKLLAQAGDALKHVVTRHRVWLRPAAFNHAPKEYIEQLKELYPSGCKVIICGEAYCTSRDESMDDKLSIGFASPGDGMSRPSMGKRMIPLQMAFNDGMNQWEEANKECIPVTYIDNRLIDGDAIREQISQPGNHILVDVPPGYASIGDAFYEEVSPGTAVGVETFLQLINGPLAQFMSGALPALQGQGEENNQTKGGIQILRDQALGRLGIPWGLFQELWAETYRQSIEGAASLADDDSSFTYEKKNKQGKVTSTEQVKFSTLKAGNVRAYPDLDSSFPETTNAKRQTFMGLAGQADNPMIAETLAEPDNQEMAHDLIGLPDLVIPGAEARQKQLLEIQKLLKETPIPPPPQAFQMLMQQKPDMAVVIKSYLQQAESAQQTGKPLPLPPPALVPLFAPSIDVEEDDYHNYESDVVKRWLSSEERREQDAKGNQLGVLNVKLHKKHHDAAIQAAQAGQQQGKPPSESINYKDLPPEGQQQMAAQVGIKIDPPQQVPPQQITGGNPPPVQ